MLSDGMGGIEDGGIIAQTTVTTLATVLEDTMSQDFEEVLAAIEKWNTAIFRQYHEQGGATLVACRILGANLEFACTGDSFLWLWRQGQLTLLNHRHTWQNELFDRMLQGELSAAQLQNDPQKAALASFIGAAKLKMDSTVRPLLLQKYDVLFLCSDGVCDALCQRELEACLALPPWEACQAISGLVEEKDVPQQDNYTAILAAYL